MSKTGVVSIKGCRGGVNEDTHIYIKDNFHINGNNVEIECWGIFDGHSGIETSKFLEISKKSLSLGRNAKNENDTPITRALTDQ